MLTLLILGILVGLDNLQLASAMGMMGLAPGRKWFVAGIFAFFEVIMPLIGLLIGHQVNSVFTEAAQWVGPGIMLSLGLYILIRELLEKERQDIINRRWILLILPFMMSLDNLVAGIGLGTAGYAVWSTSLVIGICAGSMCFLGLLIGEKLRGVIPGNMEIISGFYLIGMAVFLMLH